MRILAAALAIGLASCVPEQHDQSADWKETFEGEVVAVNGAATSPSFRIAFYSTDADDIPDRYRIASQCIDVGYFDEDRSAFLSGYSPNGSGADRTPEKFRSETAKGHRANCSSDHAVIYRKLVDLMYEGAVLSANGDHARLTSKSGLSADIRRVPQMLLMD